MDRRDEIREELQELLSLALDEDQKMESQEKTFNEEEATQDADDDDDDIVTQEKKQAQQEDVIDVKLESQKSNEDAVMESENEIHENFEKEKDKQPKEGLSKLSINYMFFLQKIISRSLIFQYHKNKRFGLKFMQEVNYSNYWQAEC